VLALLPFEPEAHRRLAGHPAPSSATRWPRRWRRCGVGRHLAVFGAAAGIVRDRLGAVDIVLPTVPHLDERIRHGTAAWPVAPRIVVEPEERRKAFRQAGAALAKSGTVTLELALARVPTDLT
jgi:lipid-A-disaccharide synthase